MGGIGSILRAFRPKRPDSTATAQVKLWAREALGASDETALAVNEIVCHDASCPGIETVILVMEPSRRTRALKIAKPLDAVTERDIRAAL